MTVRRPHVGRSREQIGAFLLVVIGPVVPFRAWTVYWTWEVVLPLLTVARYPSALQNRVQAMSHFPR